ncbi:hypothetical protein [Flavihumibacter fluvii]|uniref:hypothetical protein n=1 Tax=Flavihumibacter fluvii TaxID=2838157 RepID=UPI001BDF6738|nr:hypothetical protein [Flavihumibacter fluvii]ULQ54069.1 hypothetical protein KJS93_07020 [Flavihumibacter fluvii]
MYKKSIIRSMVVIMVLALALPVVVSGQDNKGEKQSGGHWTFLVEPYLMFPNMSGKTGVGELPDVSINASSGDIFSKLKIGAMLNLEASNDKWAIATDFIYMDLNQDVKTGTVINSGDVTAKQFAWEIAGLRRVSPWLELGLGGILNSINAGVDININNIGGGTTNRNKDLTQTWFDPMLIARVKNAPGQKFIYQVRGEIGGFGIGSDFAWQIQAYAGYRFSKLFQVTGGYRVISLDYNKGSGDNRFMYDVDTYGPVLRFGFNF